MVDEISFDEAVGKPETWFTQARQLSTAATVLYQALQRSTSQRPPEVSQDHAPGCFKAYMLLLGLALENAFKAAVVAKKAPQIKNGNLDMKPLGGGKAGHNLLSLASKAKLTTNESEEELLKRLTVFVTWAGRYQFPRDAETFRQAERKNPRRGLVPSDLTITENLLNRAAILAGYSEEHGWPS